MSMEAWDWSQGSNMLVVLPSCHINWTMRNKNAHSILDLYPLGLTYCCGPGLSSGLLGWVVFVCVHCF